MSDNEEIRLDTWNNEEINVCEHITIKGIKDKDGCSEYVEKLHIYCNECKKLYKYNVLIN